MCEWNRDYGLDWLDFRFLIAFCFARGLDCFVLRAVC